MQIPPEECARIRRGEQERACEQVGVTSLTMLDHPDGMLVYSLDLRRDIARVIRQFKPDAVVGMGWDIDAPWGLNMADHRVAGLVTIDAIRDADNTWVHPALATDEGLPKWGTRWLLVAGHHKPTHGIAVSDGSLARAVRSLEMHEEYLAAIPGHPTPSEFIPEMLAAAARPWASITPWPSRRSTCADNRPAPSSRRGPGLLQTIAVRPLSSSSSRNDRSSMSACRSPSSANRAGTDAMVKSRGSRSSSSSQLTGVGHRAGRGATHRVGARDGVVAGVLVVVDEDLASGRDPCATRSWSRRRAPALDLTGEGQGGAAHVVEAAVGLDPDVDVQALAAGGLRPAAAPRSSSTSWATRPPGARGRSRNRASGRGRCATRRAARRRPGGVFQGWNSTVDICTAQITWASSVTHSSSACGRSAGSAPDGLDPPGRRRGRRFWCTFSPASPSGNRCSMQGRSCSARTIPSPTDR